MFWNIKPAPEGVDELLLAEMVNPGTGTGWRLERVGKVWFLYEPSSESETGKCVADTSLNPGLFIDDATLWANKWLGANRRGESWQSWQSWHKAGPELTTQLGWVHTVHVVSHSIGRQIFDDENRQAVIARALKCVAAICELETSAHVTIITESRVVDVSSERASKVVDDFDKALASLAVEAKAEPTSAEVVGFDATDRTVTFRLSKMPTVAIGEKWWLSTAGQPSLLKCPPSS